MSPDMVQALIARGCQVIPRSRYVVVDKGERGNIRDVSGLDAGGEPEELNSFCVLSASLPVKVYYGNNLTQLRARMRAKTADIAIGKIDDIDDIETAAAAGRVNKPKEIQSEIPTVNNLSR